MSYLDIYDWLARASQEAWRARQVTVTPTTGAAASEACPALSSTPGQSARIPRDGSAVAPPGAPQPVRLAVAASNLIQTRP
jgi:hypothetical protein